MFFLFKKQKHKHKNMSNIKQELTEKVSGPVEHKQEYITSKEYAKLINNPIISKLKKHKENIIEDKKRFDSLFKARDPFYRMMFKENMKKEAYNGNITFKVDKMFCGGLLQKYRSEEEYFAKYHGDDDGMKFRVFYKSVTDLAEEFKNEYKLEYILPEHAVFSVILPDEEEYLIV